MRLANVIREGKELGRDPNADLDSALQKFSDEKLKKAFHEAYIQAKMERHGMGRRKTRKSKKRARKTRRRY